MMGIFCELPRLPQCSGLNTEGYRLLRVAANLIRKPLLSRNSSVSVTQTLRRPIRPLRLNNGLFAKCQFAIRTCMQIDEVTLDILSGLRRRITSFKDGGRIIIG